MTKTCSKCKETKPVAEYHNYNRSKDGKKARCKKCVKSINQQYYEKNKERIDLRNKSWRADNKNHCAKYKKQYRIDNRERILKQNNHWRKNQKFINPVFRTIENLRTGLWKALKGRGKNETTMELLGCSQEYLKKHLSNQFTDGMTWDNYGKWHVDHIRPIASFDHSDHKQRKVCWHYTNLQPLWAEDNQRKSDKYL